MVHAQNISIEQIISLRTKKIVEVEEFLAAQKWEMISAEDSTKEKMGYMEFSYSKNEHNDKAEAFLVLYYGNLFSSSPMFNRLSLQTNNLKVYNTYISKIKTLGYKLGKTNVEENSIIKVYKNGSNAIQITINTEKVLSTTNTTYSFFICDTLDFGLYFEK